jgi:hypothetical protein
VRNTSRHISGRTQTFPNTESAEEKGLYAHFAAFLAAFFCFRGNFVLFFLTNFGTFGLGGVAMPTAAANFPTAAPTDFAAVTRALSGTSSVFFFGMGFLMAAKHSTQSEGRAHGLSASIPYGQNIQMR